GRRNDSDQSGIFDVGSLVREKEKGLVLLNGSAKRAAPLFLVEWRLLEHDGGAKDVELVEVVLRVQHPVAEEEERVAVKGVGPALGHDVDHASRGLSELRGIGVGQ